MIRGIRSYFSLKYQGDYFTDVVSGRMVCLYKDCYGDIWQKDGRWALFRVRMWIVEAPEHNFFSTTIH